jgi:hypothetical protein
MYHTSVVHVQVLLIFHLGQHRILWFTMNDNYVFQYFSSFGLFFANCMFIFHKSEIHMVIFRCLTGLNLDWFKKYGLRCSLRSCARLLTCKKIAIKKWPFYDRIWPFCLPRICLSFTKLRFRRSFWGA